jgi:hypothetical protein
MKSVYLFFGVIAIAIVSCKSPKSAISQANIETLDAIVKNQKFHIESDWARPQVTTAMQQVLNSGLLPFGSSSGSINLIGNQNFLTVSKDSISSYLPYYGERQMQVTYGGSDSAIQFDGVMNNYKVEKDKNNGYTISFEAKSKSENFKVYIKLSPNLMSNITLIGSSRFSISYSGTVTPI